MTAGVNRLARGGRIERGRTLRFSFNGRRLTGHPGDTLASALIAHDIHLVGRSFKYHRPRGILTVGPEEPNALIQLDRGARTEPNSRATMIELYDGLSGESQNCWPNVARDVGVVNDLLAPLFPAGFYYKTFMWPGALWHHYEALIRRAAGLGRAPTQPDPDRYDHRFAHCDVLVVGAGPAGLAAALAAGRTGARVILADEQSEFGGRLLAEPAGAGIAIGGHPAMDWVARTTAEIAALPEVRALPRTTAFGYYDHNFVGLLERVADHLPRPPAGAPRQRLWRVRAKRVVLATGAIERPLVFADNDRPGILLAGAARTYLNRYGVKPGRRAVIATNNDSGYSAALDLAAAGVDVEAILDLRPQATGALVTAALGHGLPVLPGHGIVATRGRGRVREVSAQALTPDGRAVTGGAKRIACDLVAMSGGWNPAVHLHSQARGRLAFDPDRATFVPDRMVQPAVSAGAAAGALSTAQCLDQGARAGIEAARAAGFAGRKPRAHAVEEPAAGGQRNLWLVPAARPAARTRAFVDFQNDVQAKDLTLAVREGYSSAEHVKRYTTTGMGTDQGKLGNINALGIVADAVGATVPEVGTTTFRPPFTPVAFGAIAGRNLGRHYDPVRTTPMHGWAEDHGARFEDVGQWKRAWYFPRGGESMADAVQREAKAARTGVGILDATTLGKIEVQGRDARQFLNLIYTNAWSKLAPGRARYGLMLGEDGMVMDDGVTTCLADDRFLMTTTTGNAARVLAWMEEWLQTEWPAMKVRFTSVTEQWATASICGPKARDLLADLAEGVDLGGEAFPHMAVREAKVAGVAARIARISFTGDLSFEINVAASHGAHLWQALIEAGGAYAITPYGTEAMHLLRAEKGFIIVGQDTDGTVTPFDLGMAWIVSKKKPDFIGKRSLSRPDTRRADRKHLVGLMTEDPNEVLEEGAQIVADPDQRIPMAMIGHVTSSYRSPNLGRSIAMALVKGGAERLGEVLYVLMADKTIRAKVAPTQFFDPAGERLNA